jgi:hypothetical protein
MNISTDVPDEPSVPDDPDEPSIPDDPDEPSVPDDPDEPSVPDDPDEPSIPDDPDDPELTLDEIASNPVAVYTYTVLSDVLKKISPTSPVTGKEDDTGIFSFKLASNDCNSASLPL